MELWQAFLRFLNTESEVPTWFGYYHLMWLAIMTAATILMVAIGPKHSHKQVTNVVLVTAVVVAALEICKQINYTFGDGSGTPEYQWYAFPFQFCSTPMYVGLLAGMIRRGRVHDSLCAYLATYAVFAGLAVMIYPNDAYISTNFINFQTMICHGSMVVIGAYLLGSGHVKLKFSTLLKAMPVFAVCVAMAAVMNVCAYRVGLLEDHNFNMFYISPYLECSLPVYSLVHNAVPFPVNLVIYILGFTAAAGLILVLAALIRKAVRRTGKKRK